VEAKKKLCNGCNELQYIWKKEGPNRYCKSCWSQQSKNKKSLTLTPKPLNKKSSKQEKIERLYSILRTKYLLAHPFCEASLPGCQVNATDIHHKAGRQQFMLDDSTYLAVCRLCHTQIEENPEMAKTLGLSESREKKRNE